MFKKTDTQGFASDHISKRDFLQRSLGLGLALSSAAPFLSGHAFAQSTPKKGGHLVLGVEGASNADTLDPATYVGTYLRTLGYQWGNTLVELTGDGSLAPELAESWESDASGKNWTFKLRRGVQFHNGKELTVDDVIYTFEYHKHSAKSAARTFFEPVLEIKQNGKYEFTIVLDAPNADCPFLFSDYHLLILPKDGDPKAGIGTGGYILDTFEPGVRAIAKRSKNYWRSDRAFADSVETLALNDPGSRISALHSGRVNFINRVSPKIVSLLKNQKNARIVNLPSAGYNCFTARCDMSPYSNKDLRLALKYAIDREALIKNIYNGFGVIGNDQPVSKFDRFYADSTPRHEYDPEKAKFHLKKSGHDGPLSLTVSGAAFPGAVDAATLYQNDAVKAGMTIDVNRVPEDGYWSERWMKDSFCASYATGRPTADMVMSLTFKSTAPWNESFWRRPDFDQLLALSRAELDIEKRKVMYADLQTMISDDCGMIIPVFVDEIFGLSNDVDGLVPSPVWVGARAGEQLYFTS